MRKNHYHAARTAAACCILSLSCSLSAQNPGTSTSSLTETHQPLGIMRYASTVDKADRTAGRYPLLSKILPDAPGTASAAIVTGTDILHERTARSKAAMRAARTADGRELWGNITYSNTWESNDSRGFYTFNATSPLSVQMIGTAGSYYMEGNGGAVFQDDRLYITRWFKGGPYYYIYLNTYDPETMQQLGSTELEDITFIASETATHTATGITYGEFYNSDATGFVLGTVDYATMSRKDFGTSENTYVALGVTADNVLYGVADDGNLYRISTDDGTETLIGSTGVTVSDSNGGHYGQSGEIDQKTGTFYWVCKDASKNTALYTVDLTTGAATKVADFGGQETVYGLTVPAAQAADDAPASVSDLETLFDNGSTTGYVGFTMPTETFAGATLSGTLDYYIVAGTDTLSHATAEAGAEVIEEVTVPEGLTTFNVTAANAAGSSPVAKSKVYVGYDEPKPVQNVTLAIDASTGVATLSWDAATEGLNGGYVGKATYNIVRYPDNVTVAHDYDGTTFTETLAEGSSLQSYYYGVTALNGKHASTETASNKTVYGAAIVPPYSEALDTEEGMSVYTIIDSNNDGSTWEFYEKGDLKAASYKYSRTNAGDDWLITPAIQLKGGKLYSVSFEPCSYGYSYNERIEVKWGDAPTAEAMTNTLLEPTDILSPTFTKYTRELAADKDRKVFIGFHAVSDADEFRLYLRNISIYEGMSLSLPDSATNLTVKADADGQLKASGSFTTPCVNLGGEKLEGALSSVEVTRGDGKTVATFEAPDTCATLSFEDTEALQGFNTYTVHAYTSEGEGRSVSAKVYVGIDTPVRPATPSLTDGTTSLHLEWNPVGTTGANGGVVKPEDVWYKIYTVSSGSQGTTAELVDSVKNATSYDLPYATNEGTQQPIQLGLAASTTAGTSQITGSSQLIVGTPYALPVSESLAGGNVSILWWGNNSGNSAFGLCTDTSCDNDGGSFKLNIAAPYETAWINTGKIALGGAATPKLRFSHYADPLSDMRLTVEVQKPDGTVDEIYTYDYAQLTSADAATWRKATVSLADYTSLPYVMVRFRGNIGVKAYNLYIDGISVSNVYPYDLQASVSAPAQVRKGSTGTVKVTVKNNGDNATSAYTVRLLADGVEVASQKADAELQPLESTVYTFDYEASLFNEASEAVLKAVVELDADGNTADNEATARVELTSPTQAKPENASAQQTEGGSVAVTWAAPADDEAAVTDDMENYDSWNTDNFGEWKSLYQGEKGGAGVLYSTKEYEHQGEKFAYIAFDPESWAPEVTAQAPSLVPHSGDKYLAAFYSYTDDGNNTTFYDGNDWLISPALSGKEQTVTFWVNNLSVGGTDYAETYDVLYSTEGTDLASFVKLGETRTVSGGKWQQATATLPEGATHFALHHNTPGAQAFVFMVDDVTYMSGSGRLKGYNIYRDGKLVGTVSADKLAFTDGSAAAGTHTYAVTAVYADGESLPATASETTVGIASLAADGTASYTVYTTDGRLVAKDIKSLRTLKSGVYVVNDRTIVVK